MLESPLSMLELIVYVSAIIMILVGVVLRRRHMIIWSFTLVLVNVILYAKTYTISAYVSSTLLLLGSTSLITMIFTSLITYMLDRGIIGK